MPDKRYRFFNGLEIVEQIIPTKLTRAGLQSLLEKVQGAAGSEVTLYSSPLNLVDTDKKNVQGLLKRAGFRADDYRGSYGYAVTKVKVETTLPIALVIAIDDMAVKEMERSPCPDAIMMDVEERNANSTCTIM
jgi:hypothetical protein